MFLFVLVVDLLVLFSRNCTVLYGCACLANHFQSRPYFALADTRQASESNRRNIEAIIVIDRPDPGRGAVGGGWSSYRLIFLWVGLIVPPPNAKRMKTLPSLVFFLLLAACALSPSRGVPATLVLLHDAVNTVSKIIIWNS